MIHFNEDKNGIEKYVQDYIERQNKQKIKPIPGSIQQSKMDFFHLTQDEIDMLLIIHRLVMEGILNVGYPMEIFLK